MEVLDGYVLTIKYKLFLLYSKKNKIHVMSLLFEWDYNKSHIITSVTTLIDYQVKFTVRKGS